MADEMEKDSVNYIYQTEIREGHLDTFGHVNNAVYLTLLEEARWDLMHKNGFGLEIIKKSPFGPVILEVNVKYLAELRNRDKVFIYTSIPKEYVGMTVGNIYQEIYCLGENEENSENKKKCTEAIYKVGVMDLVRRKLIRPPVEWLNALGLTQ